MTIKLLFVSLLMLLSNLTFGQTALIRVEISNLKNNRGICRFCLFTQEQAADFPTLTDKATRCTSAPITTGKSTFVFDNVPSGVYAIATFHDANNNNKMDTNFVGIPKEAYAVSNNARGGLASPPRFESARFTHHQSQTVVAIDMNK